jgi:O-antigen/teichoic acid export membrane protein
VKSVVQVFTFEVLSKVLMGITGILVIRYLAPAQYAALTVATALAGATGQILGTAVNRVYVVSHHRRGVDDPLAATLGIQLAGVGLLAVVGAPLIAREAVLGTLVLGLVLAMCLSEFAKTLFQRDLRFMQFSAVEVSRSAGFMVVVLLLIVLMPGRIAASHVLAAQVVTMGLVFIVAVGRTIPWRKVFDVRGLRAMAGALLRGRYRHLFLYFVVIAFLFQMNIGLLRWLSDELQVATYGASYRYYGLILLVLGAVNQVMLPLLQSVKDEDVHGLLRANLRFAAIIAVPVLLGVWLAQWVIPAIDGGKYPDSVPAFQILAVSALGSIALSPFAYYLMRQEDFRFLLRAAGAAAVLQLAGSVFLTATYGAVGAAVAFFVSLAVLDLTTYARARGRLAASLVAPEG